MVLKFMTALVQGNGIKTFTPKNVKTWTVFLRQRLSRLTFPKVFCLQTALSDLKVIDIFMSKIMFPSRNSRKERS